jgi:hypothetical protein
MHDCRKTVATLSFFLFPLKHNRHDTFLACCNCRRDRTGVYLDDTVVVNCWQCVATRLFFMFPFGREHHSDVRDSYDHMEIRLNKRLMVM